ncbi:MAG: hypothetical protein EZS28_018082 [Streblomastix strix]|uniref:Uncharacterized protein n=1 Tax=Streblomastix strix TaxID=222440 RepID=A0A5J4VUN0_9EUKA|nr:MAG: hypothetical protein EZS28_018082 [Streblomastix strix]
MGQIFSKIQSLFEHNFNEEINFQTEEINDFPSKWRCISPGLTVEGICTNNSCLAYNKKVIHNVGFGEFDILKSEAFCPMCKESIIPLAPGFSQCFCHIKYKKKSCQEKQIPWLKTTNKYKIFQQDESCAVEYEKLEIDARELGTGQLVEKSIQEQIDVIRKEQAQILKEKEDAQIDKENQQVENEYEQHSVLLLDGSNVISDGAYAQHIFAVNEFINIQSQKGGVQTTLKDVKVELQDNIWTQ